jgi:hypothetical protein
MQKRCVVAEFRGITGIAAVAAAAAIKRETIAVRVLRITATAIIEMAT